MLACSCWVYYCPVVLVWIDLGAQRNECSLNAWINLSSLRTDYGSLGVARMDDMTRKVDHSSLRVAWASGYDMICRWLC